MKKRKRYTAEFEARVALEAIKGIETIHEIAARYEVHPVQVSQWKKALLERVPEVFERGKGDKDKEMQRERARLERKVGQLSMEVDWQEKKCAQLGIPTKGRDS